MVTVQWGAPRDVIRKGRRTTTRDVTLRSTDDGATYLGASGEDGLVLVLRHSDKYVARLEDRIHGNSWAGEAKRSPQLAINSLKRETQRLSRAAGVRT